MYFWEFADCVSRLLIEKLFVLFCFFSLGVRIEPANKMSDKCNICDNSKFTSLKEKVNGHGLNVINV